MRSMHLTLRPLALACLFAATPPLACAEPPAGAQAASHYQVTLDSKVSMNVPGQGAVQDIQAFTVLAYTLNRADAETSLVFDSTQVKATQGANVLIDAYMDREKFRTTQGGTPQEVPAATAPPQLKQMLQDSFGVTVCKLKLDQTGKELSRTVVAGPGAKALIDNGQVANARLYHPPFPADQDKWQAEREVSMGNGGYARGTLNYEKLPNSPPGQTKVKVSGTLGADNVPQPGTPLVMRQAKYEVSGQQTYDHARHDWSAGNLVFQVSFQMEASGKPVASATGTLDTKLETVAADPRAPR